MNHRQRWKHIALLTFIFWGLLIAALFIALPRIGCESPTTCSQPYDLHVKGFVVIAPLLFVLAILINYPPSVLKQWVRT